MPVWKNRSDPLCFSNFCFDINCAPTSTQFPFLHFFYLGRNILRHSRKPPSPAIVRPVVSTRLPHRHLAFEFKFLAVSDFLSSGGFCRFFPYTLSHLNILTYDNTVLSISTDFSQLKSLELESGGIRIIFI